MDTGVYKPEKSKSSFAQDGNLGTPDTPKENINLVVPSHSKQKQLVYTKIIKKLKLIFLNKSTIAAVVLIAVSFLAIPKSRYALLNQFNVKASTSFLVLDSRTRQPLRNIEVSIGEKSTKTDIEGRAILQNLKLGKQNLKIHKIAFETISRQVTIGWGSNNSSDILMIPTGAQYSFIINDFLSGLPVPGVEVSHGESSAISNNEGKAILTLEEPSELEFEVQVSSKQYRTDKYLVASESKSETTVSMVNKRRHLFLSERSGKPDLYSIYIDGKDAQQVIAASGSERQDQALIPSPSGSLTAYVSTRGNQRNPEGYLLSNLLVVDAETSRTAFVATSEQIYVLGWSGDWLIYVQVTKGSSGPNSNRHQLYSYNTSSGENKQIASANYFNNFLLSAGYIIFSVNGVDNPAAARLVRVKPDGTSSIDVFSGEVWNLTSSGYGQVTFQSSDKWYDYSVINIAPSDRKNSPAENNTLNFVDSRYAKQSLWLDIRDGKPTILLYDKEKNSDKVLLEQKSASTPLSWLDDTTVIYRVFSKTETADYAISTLGGGPVKVTDVKNTKGVTGLR